jgi:vesicle coat complex subunit
LAPDVTSNINANLQGVAYLNVAQNWTATQNYKANIGLDVATNISSDGVPLFSIRPEETGERTFIVKTPTDHYGFRLNNIGAAISANDAVTLSQLNNVVNYGTNTYLTKSPQLQQIVVV